MTATRLRPINNNVLVEVIRDDDGVSRTDQNENKQMGILVDVSVSNYHLTASAAIRFDDALTREKHGFWTSKIGHKVVWEQLAEAGQTFERDGKTYALIPWWRILAVEEEETK